MKDNLRDIYYFEDVEDSQIDGIIPDGKERADKRPPAVVSIPINRIVPNRKQARFILPPDINQKFYSRQLSCFEAGAEFIRVAGADPILNNIIKELIRLGKSIAQVGQILPVVGAWERAEMGDLYFDLYLGARRFWGMILYSLKNKEDGIPSLFALEVDKSRAEDMPVLNVHQASLSAIEKSKAIAGLILNRSGTKKIEDETDMDHYRAVLAKRRYSGKIWKEVEEVFGVDQHKAQELMSYLNFADKVLYFAAAAHISEDQLKDLAGKDEADQLTEIRKIFSENNAGEEEVSFSSPEPVETKPDAEMMSEVILKWFELSAERGSEKDFLDVAALLLEQVEDAQELEMIARRLINLARDIRVAKTRI